MSVSSTKIFDEMKGLILRQYPTAIGFRMPYCSLYTDPVSHVTRYRVQIHWRKKPGNWAEEEAIAELDPDTAGLLVFKEGFHWENWI